MNIEDLAPYLAEKQDVLRKAKVHNLRQVQAIAQTMSELSADPRWELYGRQIQVIKEQKVIAKKNMICECCLRQLKAPVDIEDGVTIPADCCERTGLCANCRRKWNHDCDDPCVSIEAIKHNAIGEH